MLYAGVKDSKGIETYLAPYPMETNTLVQTLETPTEATGSPSEGTDPSWALFHLGARLIPPPACSFRKKAP